MNLLGILIGLVIIAGLIFAMGKMSNYGVEINDNFRCGDCLSCGERNPEDPRTCVQYRDLNELHLKPKQD